MKAVIQRVANAAVEVGGETVGKCGKGFMILLGVMQGDTKADADKLAKKIANLRIFEDENEKMNLNLEQVGGSLLVVSQFTLYAVFGADMQVSLVNDGPVTIILNSEELS